MSSSVLAVLEESVEYVSSSTDDVMGVSTDFFTRLAWRCAAIVVAADAASKLDSDCDTLGGDTCQENHKLTRFGMSEQKSY